MLPGAVIALFGIAALFGPWLAPHDPVAVDLNDRHLGPFSRGETGRYHLIGTDDVGRDILSRVLDGARNSAYIMTLALIGGIILGVPIALVSGWYRGIVDEVITRLVDIWMALPFLMLAFMVNAIFASGSFMVLVTLLALSTWASYVRILRAQVLVIREAEYIEAARINGAGSVWIIRKHIWPNVYGLFLVIATINATGLILAESTLSFLGIGIIQPNASWGVMIERAADYIAIAPHELLIPVALIIVITYGFIFLGDWLRDRNQYGDIIT